MPVIFAAVMRILVLTNRVPFPLTDGGALGMDVFLKGFPEAGCPTRLLAMNTTRHHVAPEKLPPVWPGLEKIRTVDVDNTIRSWPLLRNWIWGKSPYHVERFWSDAFAQALVEELADFRPDVVHIESPFLASYLPLIRKHLPTAKTAFRMNNVEAEIWQRLAGEERNSLKRRYLQSLSRRMAAYEKKVWPLFDVLLPVTAEDAAAAARYVPENRIRVVPFCIDLKKYPSQPWPEKPAAYHLAAMDWLPNVEAAGWFIDAIWPLISGKLPALEVFFAGRHMSAKLLQKSAGGLHVLGEIPDAAAFTADKNILIVPLKSGGGIRVKILEAMASGKLVVSTRVGMQGIPVESGVHALLADTPEDFATALADAAGNSGKMAEIARAGAAFARARFDRKAIMEGLVKWLA